MRIYCTDIIRAGYCGTGMRRWFERYGLDFRTFLKDGIDEEVLAATGDAMALRVIEVKHNG